MGFQKQYRPTITEPVESLGSTAGLIAAWPPITIVTATATGLVYQLPVPHAGQHKRVIIDYNGATGNLTIANKSTGTVFNGSTANVITCASSESHLNIDLIGMSTAQWSAVTSTGGGVTFSGSTVTG